MTRRRETQIVRMIDAAGREWRVRDYAIYAGKTQRYPIGSGQYRGFEPVDGGARRTFLMFETDRLRGTSLEVLRDQLAASKLFHRDDPAHCAMIGVPVERVDPPR